MEITSTREEMVFKSVNEGKVSYSIGISKKKEDGTYEKGYIPVRFKKDVNLENQTKIKIKKAWLDFFKIEKRTLLYIFISEFEEVQEKQEEKSFDNWSSAKDIEPDDLPFY